MKRTSGSKSRRCLFLARTTATLSCIAQASGLRKTSGRMCLGISRHFIPTSRCSINRIHRRQRLPAHARSRGRRVCTTFTPETSMTAKAAALAARVAGNCRARATGMSLGNGIWKMESVDFAAMPFPADSKRVPGNGVRGVFQSNWRLNTSALSRIEAHRSNVCSVTCRLDFGTPFYLIRGVSAAADDVTSLSAVGPESRGGIAFTTTHWSVVLEAQGESPQAQEALEKLCRTYWRPIYSFIRRQGSWTEDAEDLT